VSVVRQSTPTTRRKPASSNKKKEGVTTTTKTVTREDDVSSHVITFSSLSLKREHMKHKQIAQKEAQAANSMCLPIAINGITMGVALVDQGASRSVMRRSCYERFRTLHGPQAPRIIPVTRMYVLSSSNEVIPIIGRFRANITYSHHGQHPEHAGVLIASTLIYVAEDTDKKDIICDMIIGRSTMATSKYSCIDLKGTGALISNQKGDAHSVIPCSNCSFYDDAQGRSQLQAEVQDDARDSTIECNTYASHIMRIHTLVNSREGLTADAKAHLHSHLLTHYGSFSFGNQAIPTKDEEETLDESDERDDESHFGDTNEVVQLCHLMSELDKTVPCSPEETNVVTAILSTFVPDVVEKPARVMQKNSEKGDSMSGKPTLSSTEDEVDEIEFPFTPPTMREDSPEYHQAKAAAIAEMINKNTLLDTQQKQQLTITLMKHADRFSMKGENMERTDSVQHEIDTKDRRPFRERLRQYSPAIQEVIMREVETMLKQGVIVPSKSAYASNLLLVRKPDESSEGGVKNRVCASFVQLNAQTEKDSYPLPNIQYIFDRIGRSVWFTTMDLLSGFWQVMIKPEHRHKTAFITMRGLYEYVVVPFGLCNAPATFQRMMDAIILPEYRAFIETYIDDLMTHSKTFEDHLRHLDILLTALKKHRLVVKLNKCKFAQKEVKFLGHVISHNIIKTNPEAVAAIKNWQRPLGGGKTAVTAVRGFLGMAGWYRKFIPNFAKVARPLVNLTKNDVVWEWSGECQQAFESLRDALTVSPVLAVADPNKPFIMHTDASDHAMGAILQQEDSNGDLHPIAYASKTFNSAQTRYATTEREALAIVWALQHFNTYCEGHKYTLLTDHQALSYIRTNKDNSKRISRWQLLLQHYHLDIHYIKGKDNHAADLLSRDKMELITANTIGTKRKAARKESHDEDYEVELVVAKRPSQHKKGDIEYRIRWKGYVEADDTWVSSANAAGARIASAEFEKREAAKLALEKSRDDEYNLQSRADFKCQKCNEVFANDAARHIHHYHQHQIQMPTDLLRKMEVTTDVQSFAKLQQQEKQFRCIFNSQLGELDIPVDKYEKRTLTNHEFIMTDQGLLMMMDTAALRTRLRAHTQLRLCVPSTERQRILYEIHNKSSHPGVMHMYDLLQERYWWPSMLKDTYKYVSTCRDCQVNKGEKNTSLSRPMTIPSKPWSHIAIDHVGPFPMSNSGNKYILVIVDRFTRYVEAVAVTDTSAKTTAEVIMNHIICRYGVFEVLLSDRGSGFLSEIFTGIMKLLGIKQKKTTAFHPKSNGMVERFNKTLKKMLKRWVNQQHTDWDLLLPFALFAYNTSKHSTLKETPYYLNFARQARTITDTIIHSDFEQVKSVHAYSSEVAEKLKNVHDQVRVILNDINHKRQTELDDIDDKCKLTVGDEVYLHDSTTPIQRSHKFIKRWLGPFLIIQANNNGTSVIMKNDGTSLVSNDRLRRVVDGTTDLRERHQRDMELATEELQLVAEKMSELTARQTQLEAAITVANHGQSLEATSTGLSSSQDHRITPGEEEHKCEDEASVEDEESIEVNMMTMHEGIRIMM
jgi:transposase InsO family protein